MRPGTQPLLGHDVGPGLGAGDGTGFSLTLNADRG
jgi:hypothetical protein